MLEPYIIGLFTDGLLSYELKRAVLDGEPNTLSAAIEAAQTEQRLLAQLASSSSTKLLPLP